MSLTPVIDWLIIHLQYVLEDARRLFKVSVQEFIEDRCTQLAASISYFVFFSIFPLSIFLVTVFGQFLRNDDVKQRVVDSLVNVLPLVAEDGRDELEQVLNGVSTDLSLIGMFALVGLIWSASAMMAALRGALNTAWDTNYRRPALRGKIVDIFMIFFVFILVALSIAGTWVRTYVMDWVLNLSNVLGPFSSLVSLIVVLVTWIFPIFVSFLIFSMLYRFVPAVKTSFAEIWVGALVAAIGFELAKIGFTLYLQNFGNYNAIYGSLGAVIVFMLFIFVGPNVLLFGAEIASEWPRVRAGFYDEGLPERTGLASGRSISATIVAAIRRSIFGRGKPEHVEDELIEERSRQQRAERLSEIAERRRSGSVERNDLDD